MTHRDGRVTILPAQSRRLAELSKDYPGAIEVVQYGSVLHLDTGTTKFSVDADGNYIHNTNPDQESLPC